MEYAEYLPEGHLWVLGECLRCQTFLGDGCPWSWVSLLRTPEGKSVNILRELDSVSGEMIQTN